MTAIACRRRGHRCRIFERNRAAHEAGMGFILMPQAIALLESFGVQLDSDLAGVALESYIYRNSAGDILHQERMPAGARSFRRRDLISALVGSLPGPDAIVFGAELERFEFGPEGRVIAAVMASGDRVSADLYVAADGIHSQARQALFPDWPAPMAQSPEVVGLVRSLELIRWAGSNFNKFHAPGGGLAVGVLPVDFEHLVWFLQFDAQRFAPPTEEEAPCRNFTRELIGGWGGPIQQLLSLTDFSRAHVWLPVDTDLVPCFHQGNLVLVGDAAHPLLPFTSQGVSAAIADAVTLAKLLDQQSDLSVALATYSRERREHCQPFIGKGRELLQRFLSPQDSNTLVLPIA